VDEEYYSKKRETLAQIGYDAQDTDAMMACERRGMAALRKLFYVYVLDFFGRLKPEEARGSAEPLISEYNDALKTFADISESAPKGAKPS
jgi:hypothetical protein